MSLIGPQPQRQPHTQIYKPPYRLHIDGHLVNIHVPPTVATGKQGTHKALHVIQADYLKQNKIYGYDIVTTIY